MRVSVYSVSLVRYWFCGVHRSFYGHRFIFLRSIGTDGHHPAFIAENVNVSWYCSLCGAKYLDSVLITLIMKASSRSYDVIWFVVSLLYIALLSPSYVAPTPVILTLQEVFTEVNSSTNSNNIDSAKAKANQFLYRFDREANRLQVEYGKANWNYETDLTEQHLKRVVEIGERTSTFYLSSSTKVRSIPTLDLPANISRQISLVARTASPVEKELRMEISTLVGNMTKIYGSATVNFTHANGTVTKLTNSDLSEIFRTSENETLLKWAWKSWRDTVGPPTKRDFTPLIDYLNIGAREHSWIDYGRYLRSDYETSDLEESLDEVWTQIESLYRELHGYVRYKLTSKYNISGDGCIPASLLGDMYAQNWENIFSLVKPSNSSKAFDVTKELRRQNYTVEKMFRLAESFFTSIGLDAMPESFWSNSVMVKPKDKEMVCHASAWDVSKDDVR